MNNNLATPAELLRIYGKRAKKRYSQNFLSDVAILDRILDVANVRGGPDNVVEIGPGPGGLTTRILERGAQLTAVEADPDMVAHLRAVFGELDRFDVLEGDVLALDLPGLLGTPPATVVANLPYAIATEVLFRLLDLEQPPQRMALMFQREVAQRIAALPGERGFGMPGLATWLRYQAYMAIQLKPGAFIPPPKVSSTVVEFRLRSEPLAPLEERQEILRVARVAFGQRRKMLRKSLTAIRKDTTETLEALGIKPTLRPEQLDGASWLALARFRSVDSSAD